MTPQDLARLRKMSLADKIEYSKTVIREFYERMDGKVYVSFSGGKDSTVLLHLVRSIYPDTPGMFIDTGLEYPEILEHVKTFDNTGCVFCMYGIMKDKQRFVMLKATHPDLHEMCMKPLEEGGLGMKPVLEFMNIPTGCEQCTLTEYNGEKKNDK